MKLPPDQRPHFITLHYANVDSAGHKYGPNSRETSDAVRHVDEMIGKLVTGLSALSLPVDLFVVSDHGMDQEQGDWILLDKYADLSKFQGAGSLMYAPSEADAEKAYEQLKGASDKFEVYRRAAVPPSLHYNDNPREGDPVVVATGPYEIMAKTPDADHPLRAPNHGVHGYDPALLPNMRAIFYAAGPDIRPGVTVAPFENIHIYPLIAKILGLRIGNVDGKLEVLQPILREPQKTAASALSSEMLTAVSH